MKTTAAGATTLTTVSDTGRGFSSSASRRRTRICSPLPSSTSTNAMTAEGPCRTIGGLEVGSRVRAVAGPGAVGDVHDPETGATVGVPDVTASRVERRRRHRVRPTARRLVEVGDFARLVRVADVEHSQAGQDHAARDDAGVVLARDGAVVRGVALRSAGRTGIVLLVRVAR